MIKTIFWNSAESRVRFGWRFLGLIALFIVTLFPVSYAVDLLVDQGLIPEMSLEAAHGRVIIGLTGLARTLFCMWLAGRFLDRRPFSDFGNRFNRHWWRDLVFGLVLGALLVSAIFAVELAAGWVTLSGFLQTYRDERFWLSILANLFGYVCVGIYEEQLIRGYFLTNLSEWLNNFKRITPRWAVLIAVLITAILFGVSHAANPNTTVISTLNISLSGIFLAIGFILTGELAIPIGLHIAWNFFQGNVFGFPVSGLRAEPTTFIAVKQVGPAWITGGAFGPEAGVISLAAMLLGVALVILWANWRYGRLEIAELIAAPPSVDNPPAI